jgi:DNA-binding SARP family transcriptional activator
MEASRGPVARAPLVRGKITLPVGPERLVARPRLVADIARLCEEHRVVAVWATAGAGKTTAIVEGVGALGLPVAWLTLDPTDAAPGRLLMYLEAAIRRALPDTPAAATEALGAGVVHPEAAGLLAQAIPAEPAVLVVDELERIADWPAALEVVSGFLRYLGPAMTVVLVGRREVELDALSRLGYGALGHLGERHLAFDDSEAAEALALQGHAEVDPRSVVEATGGWVTGVLFEAWRSHDHVGGSGGEADPLAGYLAEQILAGLADDEREFLVLTSLITDVDVERAAALGLDTAADLLARLRRRHLPTTWRDGGTVMRCHPRFREYLRSLLDRRDRASVLALRRRLGLALAAEGRHEEAVEELLAAGHVADAAAPAEHALRAAIARLDLPLAQGWLDRFASTGLLERPSLLTAQLRVSIAHEEYQRAVEVADRLRALGHLAGEDPEEAETRALAAWGYWHVGRLADARETLAVSSSGRVGDVVRYLHALVDGVPPEILPQFTGGPLDPLILRIAYVHGRLTAVRDAPVSEWTPGATERIAAYRALGELEHTGEVLASGESRVSNLRFTAIVATELLLDLGQEEPAREELVRGRSRIVRSGSFVFDMVSRLLAAKLELRMRRDAGTALLILGGIERAGPSREYGYLAEQIDLWKGCALLLEGNDGDALDTLAAAVASMCAADRILELPTAAVYLAEAQWRAGNAAAADEAADLALAAAHRQGSRHILVQALDDFPAVLARRLDAEESVDGPWHEIGRSLAARPRVGPQAGTPRLTLRDMGAPALFAGAEERRPRIAKSYALLAYLLHARGTATRAQLLDALFDGRADGSTRAYLRQAAHVLRQVLPPGVELLGEGDAFVLRGVETVESDTLLLQARLASAASLIGTRRIEVTTRAIEVYERGAYLEGVECAWVQQRRVELAAIVADARIDMAVAALEESRFEMATDVLTRVLDEDPYRERAWRLLMRVAAAQGLEDRVIEAYRRCEAALAELGLEPSESTRMLAGGLRR